MQSGRAGCGTIKRHRKSRRDPTLLSRFPHSYRVHAVAPRQCTRTCPFDDGTTQRPAANCPERREQGGVAVDQHTFVYMPRQSRVQWKIQLTLGIVHYVLMQRGPLQALCNLGDTGAGP